MTAFSGLAVALLAAAQFATASFPIPRVAIDLDRPETSWPIAVRTVLEQHGWEHSFGPVFAAHNASLFDNLSPAQWEALAESVQKFWPENARDIQAIVSGFDAAQASGLLPAGASVSFEYLAGWVWFHELAHTELADFSKACRGGVPCAGGRTPPASPPGCTGLVANQQGPWRTAAGLGDIVHVRNMDQSPAPLRNISLQLDFERSGELQFRAVDWYWVGSGVMTAVRRGAASLEENWRFANVSSADVFAAAGNGTVPQLFVFRRLLEGLPLAASGGPVSGALASAAAARSLPPASFADVLARLEALRVASPMYVIAGGSFVGEGAVVVVQTLAPPVCVQTIGNWSCGPGVPPTSRTPYDAGTEPWMVAQTNYDPWDVDPPSDARRTAALRVLAASGADLGGSPPGLMAAAGTYPVHNPDTAYTAVMRAGDGSLSAWAREALVPAPDA